MCRFIQCRVSVSNAFDRIHVLTIMSKSRIVSKSRYVTVALCQSRIMSKSHLCHRFCHLVYRHLSLDFSFVIKNFKNSSLTYMFIYLID